MGFRVCLAPQLMHSDKLHTTQYHTHHHHITALSHIWCRPWYTWLEDTRTTSPAHRSSVSGRDTPDVIFSSLQSSRSVLGVFPHQASGLSVKTPPPRLLRPTWNTRSSGLGHSSFAHFCRHSRVTRCVTVVTGPDLHGLNPLATPGRRTMNSKYKCNCPRCQTKPSICMYMYLTPRVLGPCGVIVMCSCLPVSVGVGAGVSFSLNKRPDVCGSSDG